ncbi:prepilin-type N-terminal cleavage/methylation domain-containing protein [Anaerophilus nitritogenes]|uniref:prepilin-type N-terminal cleavage/methylation domain-containing protein n=1 Tax=Anaerophilus nitritogenes TaxID=2498136 RepID=UPI00101DDA24|nr:prepilin-type N-terminal cleavage/methylation domain-containing protein [Anaerophilus nitritogenes]
MKGIKNNKGFTLIEALLSLTLFSIIIGSFTYFFLFQFKNCNRQLRILNDRQNVHEVLLHIQRNIRECNQQQIVYDSKIKVFELKNDQNETVYIDLSGYKNHSSNTLLYFYKNNKELRTNKNKENNVVIKNIEDIYVHEIIKKNL